nr:hypothetical protein [Tanacetum cinerariifolium]
GAGGLAAGRAGAAGWHCAGPRAVGAGYCLPSQMDAASASSTSPVIYSTGRIGPAPTGTELAGRDKRAVCRKPAGSPSAKRPR